MTEETETKQVEKHRDPKYPRNIPLVVLSINQLALLLLSLIIAKDICQDECISQIVHQGHQEGSNNQPEKMLVISATNAIIDPFAMMIKLVNAPVASSTVLGRVEHMRIANLTHELIT